MSSAFTFEVPTATVARAALSKFDEAHPLAEPRFIQAILNSAARLVKNAMAQAHIKRRDAIADGTAQEGDKLSIEIDMSVAALTGAMGTRGWGSSVENFVDKLGMGSGGPLTKVASAQVFNANLRLAAAALEEKLATAEYDPLVVTPTFADETKTGPVPQPGSSALKITFQY